MDSALALLKTLQHDLESTGIRLSSLPATSRFIEKQNRFRRLQAELQPLLEELPRYYSQFTEAADAYNEARVERNESKMEAHLDTMSIIQDSISDVKEKQGELVKSGDEMIVEMRLASEEMASIMQGGKEGREFRRIMVESGLAGDDLVKPGMENDRGNSDSSADNGGVDKAEHGEDAISDGVTGF